MRVAGCALCVWAGLCCGPRHGDRGHAPAPGGACLPLFVSSLLSLCIPPSCPPSSSILLHPSPHSSIVSVLISQSMSTMPTFSWPFVLGLALALVWTTIPHISAQSVPIAVQEFAFARSGSRLLVSGGRTTLNGNQVGLTGQLFALDLSRSWDVSNAPWVQLAASNPAYWYSMVAAPDNSTVYTLQSGVNNSMIVSTYNAQANAWLPTTMSMPPTAESRQGVRPILDPTTWMVYLDATTYLDVFNPNNTGTTSVLNMPPNTFTSRLFSGGVYNRARHSLMYYGGLNYSLQFDLQATYVTEYTINTNTWSNLVS